jgi:D-tyrosyl-tRNA(Tyr) deacylase
MKTVIQRVSHAKVEVNNQIVGEIKQGLLVLVGVEDLDNKEDIKWIAQKIVNLRIFDDANKIMNLSLKEIQGELLLISQFTLQAAIKKGNRPSYIKASKPDISIPIYQNFKTQLELELEQKIACGIFGAAMQVSLQNDGPVTLVIDSKNRI